MHFRHSNNGFTILEMIVTVGIFTFVVIAAANVLISARIAQSKAIAIQNVVDNVRFAVESVTKDLRTAEDIEFPLVSCPPGAGNQNQINFTDQEGNALAIAFYDPDGGGPKTGGIYKVFPDLFNIRDCSDTIVSPTSFRLTSEDVVTVLLDLRIEGAAPCDPGNPDPLLRTSLDGQPRVTMSILANSNDSRVQAFTTMNLQTTVTQRKRDICL